MDTPFPTISTNPPDPQPATNGPAAPVPAPALDPQAALRSAAVSVALPAAQASPADGLRDSLALALELAPQALDNLVGRALLGMDRQSTAHPDAGQRKMLDAAAIAMDGQRRRWIKQFVALLRIAFAHPPAAAEALPNADLRICASEMAELERLTLAAGSQRGNPLGPQSYIRAIFELISRSEARPEHHQVWTHFLMGALGTQLSWMYLQLAASLRVPGSREVSQVGSDKEFAEYADYVFGLGGKAPPEMLAPLMPKPELTPEMRALAEEASRTVKQLRGVLGMPEPDLSSLPEDEMARMMQDIEESERLMLEVNKRGLKMPSAQATSGNTLSREVEKFIDEYRHATTPTLARIPTPVRDALEKLQQPLERLAAVDASMFSKSDHAVRQLLDGIAKRSLLYANETADGFVSFFTPVQKILEAVGQAAQPSANIYEQAHARLKPIWLSQDEELKALAKAKERSLAQLEVRKQLASRLAFELVSRRDASDSPVAVKQLLMGPWAQVLARAQLHPEHPQDEQRYEYAVALLLWSVSMRRAGAHRATLVQLVPDLTQALRVGLASVEHPQSNIDVFLGELKKLHEAVLSDDAEYEISEDTFPPEPPQAAADISDMMMGVGNRAAQPPPPPPAPSYQSDLNLL